MKNLFSTVILCFFFSQISLFANGNNGENDPVITLCSGATMTWEEYLEMRKCGGNDYELAIESFTPFKVNMVNNTVGAWSSVIQMPLVAAAAAQLPDGKILTWSARDKFAFGGNQGRTWTAIFDPATNTSTEALIQNTQHDMFCPGVNTLPSGDIIVGGGSSSNQTSIYNPEFDTWTAADDLNINRGYQSNVLLQGGATFTIGGSWSGGIGNKHAEIWTEKSGWFEVPGLPVDAITEGYNSTQPVHHDDYFPWLWTAPNGKIFHAGPNQRMHWIDPTGVGSYTYAGNRGNDEVAVSGTTVMYDIGEILKTGGSNTFEEGTPASTGCYSIDFNQDNVQVTQVADMNFPRVYHNSVVLPTGEVLALGGIATANVFSDNNSALVPELWNPNTQSWTQLAAMATPRNYHSVSLLMEDGRVFIAGGGLCGGCSTNHADAEIYSPPYLFNANGTLASRPVINNSPATASYGSSISVGTNTGISNFSLVSLSAVTHSTNNCQRRIPLSFSNQGGNQYSLSIPNRNILPPGNYMLFAMNGNGTPSIAKVIKIGDDINDCSIQNTPDLGGNGLTGTYFNNADLTNEALTRVDETINFSWGTDSPDPAVGSETFSVRWEGAIQVPQSGAYNFYTNVDDGVRLWVDDRIMIDRWSDSGATEDIGMIDLEANLLYNIKMEYYENGGGAVAELRWSGPGVNKGIIPKGNLFTENPCPGSGAPMVTNITKNDADCNSNNGSITFSFPDNPSRTNIEFSIDGGNSWPGNYNTSDNVGNFTINNLAPSTYDLWVRWGNDDCPTDLSDVTIDEVGCGGGGGGDPDCANITITSVAGALEIGGLDGAPIVSVQIFSSTWQTVYNCFANCNTPTENISLDNGNYYVYVKYYTSGYQLICEENGTYTVGGGTGNPCAGQGGDVDGDGICGNQDCNDNDPNLPATVGSACNDGNASTTNDVIQNDGCTCAGTPTGGGGDPDCADIGITTGAGTIEIAGLDGAPIVSVQIFSSTWQTVYNCFANCDTPTETVNVNNGNYYVYVKYYSSSYQLICEVNGTYSVGGSTGGPCAGSGGDNDGDGVCANDDCNDNDANVPATVGSACNDGNANTTGDVIQSDGCTCQGTPISGTDCGSLSVTAGAGSISVSGLDASPVSSVQIFTATTWSPVLQCFANCDLPTQTTTLPAGTYYVYAKLYTASYSLICEINETVTVGSALAAGDAPIYLQVPISEEIPPAALFIKEKIAQATADFNLFPNPAQTSVMVDLTAFVGQAVEMRVVNNLGKTIAIQSIHEVAEPIQRMNLEDWSDGIYVFQVRGFGGEWVTRRLVVAR